MKLKKLFLLNLKKLVWIIVMWIVAVLLHNLIYGLFGVEEPVFFSIAGTIIPLYFIISLIYSLVYLIRIKRIKTSQSRKIKKRK